MGYTWCHWTCTQNLWFNTVKIWFRFKDGNSFALKVTLYLYAKDFGPTGNRNCNHMWYFTPKRRLKWTKHQKPVVRALIFFAHFLFHGSWFPLLRFMYQATFRLFLFVGLDIVISYCSCIAMGFIFIFADCPVYDISNKF